MNHSQLTPIPEHRLPYRVAHLESTRLIDLSVHEGPKEKRSEVAGTQRADCGKKPLKKHNGPTIYT